MSIFSSDRGKSNYFETKSKQQENLTVGLSTSGQLTLTPDKPNSNSTYCQIVQ